MAITPGIAHTTGFVEYPETERQAQSVFDHTSVFNMENNKNHKNI